ncbi:P-loop containing nucleoside triphosphate hydrolase protein [Clavulina sp. PMI_390]|nr:P-loop containing nucleoside triphosphate hydrolase protein [Clavulina sp. PMI_390]
MADAIFECTMGPIWQNCRGIFIETMVASLLAASLGLTLLHKFMPRPVVYIWNLLAWPFQPSVALQDAVAEGLLPNASETILLSAPNLRRSNAFLAFSGMVMANVWIAATAYQVHYDPNVAPMLYIYPFSMVFCWMYTFIRPLTHAISSAPLDILVVNSVFFLMSCAHVGTEIHHWFDAGTPLPWWPWLVAHTSQIGVVALSSLVILSYPVNNYGTSKLGGLSPADKLSLWDLLTYSWVPSLSTKSLSAVLSAETSLDTLRSVTSKTLLRKLLTANRRDIAIDALLLVIALMLKYAGAFLLYLLLVSFQDHSRHGRIQSAVLAILQLLCALARSQTDALHLYFGQRCGTSVRQQLNSSILDCVMSRMNPVSDPDSEKKSSKKRRHKKDKSRDSMTFTTGGLSSPVNVAQLYSDGTRVSTIFSSAFLFLGAPVEIILSCSLLYWLLGISFLAGAGLLLLASPIIHLLALRGAKLDKGLNESREKLLSVLREILNNISVLKELHWEGLIGQRITQSRGEQLQNLYKERRNAVLYTSSSQLFPALMGAVTFIMLALKGTPLSPAAAFTSIVLFSMLRGPLLALPTFPAQISTANSALQRIEKFLNENQMNMNPAQTPLDPPASDFCLSMKEATFQWIGTPQIVTDIDAPETLVEQERKFALVDVTVQFPQDKISIITGPSESGKSALIRSFLGETAIFPGGTMNVPQNHNHVNTNGFTHSMSYSAQSPWIGHFTVKDNVIFGHAEDGSRYQHVSECFELQMQHLDVDLNAKVGLSTDISGDLRARISLARAVYSPTAYVLIDDPIDMIDDISMGRLWTRLVQSTLLERRTVLVATRRPEVFQSHSDFLVRMRDRRVEFCGTQTRQGSHEAEEWKNAFTSHGLEATADTIEDSVEQDPKSLLRTRNEDAFTWRTLWVYFTYSWFGWLLVIPFIALSQLSFVAEKLWLSFWTARYRSEKGLSYTGPEWPNMPSPNINPLPYSLVYSSFVIVTVLLGAVAVLLTMSSSSTSSKKIFATTLRKLISPSTSHLARSAAGRTYHRVHAGLAPLDSSLGFAISAVLTSFFGVSVALSIPTALVPSFGAIAIIPAILIMALATRYVSTGRRMRVAEVDYRLELFAGLSNVVEGRTSIKCYAKERFALLGLLEKLDDTTASWNNYWLLNRYLLLRLDVITAAVVFGLVMLMIVQTRNEETAGVVITTLIGLGHSGYWMCRHTVEVVLDSTKASKTLQLLSSPAEQPLKATSTVPAAWPSTSNSPLVVVENLNLRPARLGAPGQDEALRSLSLSLSPYQRVALVGRHGSGKSSLVKALLQLAKPSSGAIFIDGINISEISAEDLRARITYIPAEAVVLSGTIRENIDPFNEHDDVAILQALKEAQPRSLRYKKTSRFSLLLAVPEVTPEDENQLALLEITVSPGGRDLNESERFIISLARSVLQQRPLVIMDESTAPVDSSLASHALQMHKNHFPNSLVICVVHRLRSALDYERVVVLEEGSVVEDGSPQDLLNSPEGVFRNMCLGSGQFEQTRAHTPSF